MSVTSTSTATRPSRRRPGTAAPSSPAPPTRTAWRRRLAWLGAGLGVLVLLCAASVAIGSRTVGVPAILEALGSLGEPAAGLDQAAVVKRIPRTVLALAVGAALGVAGAVMQGVTRNPLADPGILGITMGASLAVVVGMAWFGLFAAHQMIWMAILGAAVTAVLVYAIASAGRSGASPLKLALAGAALTAVATSFITAVALPRGDISANIRSWQIGGVGGAAWDAIALVAPFLGAGLLLALVSARSLNSLGLGDDLAAGLGERVLLARGLAALSSVLLAGAATAVAGPIGFVGLVVPHACRLLAGPDHRWLLPYSAVAGAGLLLASDVLGRIIARPSEIDVGILTALIGAPFFIHIVRQRKVREL
ncbi:iron ABC transporter permease [Citricoccus sp. I39-566]|uniref:FecCD family ABC transporter permease n=1 Tax=Citricoccus sp. I39-566 TaxID=3073268 RepID=UPI00286A7797|nr:iron ABC transporter permease [Citricoccus sp. I39-566]WMY78103.1 iron ABC transporter permease [Citricoccus sp. I39-566]